MEINLEGKKYTGVEISWEIKNEGLAEKHVRASADMLTAVPYWHRHDVIKFKLESGEIMTYHEIFHDDKLEERFIDHEYYMTTEEYKKEQQEFLRGDLYI